jgi:hypothetical protein
MSLESLIEQFPFLKDLESKEIILRLTSSKKLVKK